MEPCMVEGLTPGSSREVLASAHWLGNGINGKTNIDSVLKATGMHQAVLWIPWSVSKGLWWVS